MPDDVFHPILGHELQLLELADTPLLVRRERGRSLQGLQFLVVMMVLGPETTELLVLGYESLDQALLGHRPASLHGGHITNKQSQGRTAAGSRTTFSRYVPPIH